MENITFGQGHGIEGRFGGLPNPFGEESFSQIVLLPVAFDLTTTYQKGSDKGPIALIEASRNLELYDIETNSEVYLKGIYTAPLITEKTSEAMLDKVYQETKRYLNQGKMVVTLGGEHSISYAPIRAYSEKYSKITILQLDAHADLQDSYEGNPHSHASVMMRVKELKSVQKIVSLGIRSLSLDEIPNVDYSTIFFAHQMVDGWIENVLNKLSGPIYLTFDLDFFDSSLMPSTGTPEPGGFFWNETMKFLKHLVLKHELVGFDVVELCPQKTNIAPDYLAAKLVYKLLSYKYNKIT